MLGMYLDDFPDSLRESLKKIEQGFKLQLGLNFALKEFVEKKTWQELLFKGFKFKSEISFLRKIKKVIIEAYKNFEGDDKLAKIVEQIGPLFSINSDVKVDFTHSDLEEIMKVKTMKNVDFDSNGCLEAIVGEPHKAKDIKTKYIDLDELGMSNEKL